MKNAINNHVIDFPISEQELTERAVIKGIELYASHLLKTSKGAKSTIQVSPELDSKLNAAKEFLGLSRQTMTEEALELYFKWKIYSKHIRPNTIGL